MKVRTCFVSNSSSSSFVIHLPSVMPSEKQRHDFMNELDRLREKDRDDGESSSWGDSGETYYLEGNMLFIEMNHCPEWVNKLFVDYNLDPYSENKNMIRIGY